MHSFSVRWVIANWPAVRHGSVHRAKSYQEQVTKSNEQKSYFNSTITRNWCCPKEKCSMSKCNNYMSIHNKHLDLKKIPELGGNTPAQPKADRPQSMGGTRITYCTLCLLPTLPKGFPEHFRSTAGVWPPGPRLSSRSDLWEPKPGPLVRPISLAPLSSLGLTVEAVFSQTLLLFLQLKRFSKASSFLQVMQEPFSQDHYQTARQGLVLKMPMLLSDIPKTTKYSASMLMKGFILGYKQQARIKQATCSLHLL